MNPFKPIYDALFPSATKTAVGEGSELRIGSANIRNFPDMRARYVMDDGRRMGELCDVWGAQEINVADDDYEQVMKGLSRTGYRWRGLFPNTTVPIFFRADRLIMRDVQRRRYDTVKSFRNVAVPRAQNAVVLAHRDLPEVSFVVANRHAVPAAYNARFGEHPAHELAARKEQWDREEEGFRAFIRSFGNLTVFTTEDGNHPTMEKHTDNFRWLRKDAPDYLGMTTNGTLRFDKTDDRGVKLHSDHNGLIVTGSIGRKDIPRNV